MKNLNNKGFTLVEVIAVIVLIAILGMIAVPNVLNSINKSKNSSYDILVSDIIIASQELYEELDYTKPNIYKYTLNGKSTQSLEITSNNITINLQTLVSNGLLTGSNNPNKTGTNKNSKVLFNPKNKKDIGVCSITITKTIDSNYNTSYKIENKSSSNKDCPSDTDYNKVQK